MFAFRSGVQTVSGLTADAIVSELEGIRSSAGGVLKTEDVVDAARPEDAPLHAAFTWDDHAAAEQHRRWQARQLIRCVVVVDKKSQQEAPAFVHVSLKNGDRFYQSSKVIVRRQDQFSAAVSELASKVSAAQKSLDELTNLITNKPGADHKFAVLALAAEALATAKAAVERIQ